jgi:hypothetical protein
VVRSRCAGVIVTISCGAIPLDDGAAARRTARDDVLQLANIARPVAFDEAGHSDSVDSHACSANPSCRAVGEVRGEERNVLSPFALYYMQGLNTTPVHAHTALFGVYGLLSLGLMLVVARLLTPGRVWKKWLGRSFWAKNVGLGLMVA